MPYANIFPGILTDMGCLGKSVAAALPSNPMPSPGAAPRSHLPRKGARRKSAPHRCASIRLLVRARGQGLGRCHGEHPDPLHSIRMVEHHPVRDAAAAVLSDHTKRSKPINEPKLLSA